MPPIATPLPTPTSAILPPASASALPAPAAPITPPTTTATPNPALPVQNELLMMRKLDTESAIAQQMPVIYQKFCDCIQKHSARFSLPDWETFEKKMIYTLRQLQQESHTREVWCYIELVEGFIEVSYQVKRVSLFQKRSDKTYIWR
jgi:hypothetical protein